MKFLKAIERGDDKLSIQLMDTTDEEEINNFLVSFYKSFGLRYSLDFNWFNWYYNDNPFGKCLNYILTNGNNDIVGAFGYSKFEYSFEEIAKVGIIGVNGFINPTYTGLGLYAELISETLKNIHRDYDLAFSYPHSDNIGSVKGHINSGWEFSKDFYFYVKNLNSFKSLTIDNSVLESNFEELRSYRFSKTPNMFFIKNFEWLNWRFNKRPDKDYSLIVYKNEHDIVEGYIIYTFYKDKNDFIRCQIADYDNKVNHVFTSLLAKISQVGLKNYCSTLEFLVNENHCDTEILREELFVRKEESYKMFLNGDIAELNERKDFKFEFGYFDVI